MKILCVLGKHNHGDPARGLGYEYANFVPALRSLGHEVVCFDSLNRQSWSDFAALNRALLQTVQQEQPALVFFVLMKLEVWIDTLELLRAPGGPALLNWATDDCWKYDQYSRLLAKYFDLYVTTSPVAFEKSRREGLHPVVMSQWAVHEGTLAPPLPSDQCRYDVSFVGSAYRNRMRWIQKLRRLGVEVACFGHGWPHGTIEVEEIPEIIRASRISINFADSPPLPGSVLGPWHSRQIKARAFEVPGAGGFLLTEAGRGLDRYYRFGGEIAVFEGIGDLVDKIAHYLMHPGERDAIAQRGFERTHDEHTYNLRFPALLDAAIARREQRRVSVGGPKSNRTWDVDWPAFEAAAASHKLTHRAALVRDSLEFPLSLLWGRARGKRAARRLLYEFSWRLMGERTYRAAGLPGRLYYEES